MYRYLFCGNTPVYDIKEERVLSSNHLPGLMEKNPCNESFFAWFKLRYSSNTNTLARRLKGVEFGQGNRFQMNIQTHALSLSDSYWTTDGQESFEALSPYFNDFWQGTGVYAGQSVPTLYLPGAKPKAWLDANTFFKVGSLIEVACTEMCRAAGVSCMEARLAPKGDGILVTNFTSPELMLEQADMSGRFDFDDYDADDILKRFGNPGAMMLAVDAVVGNGDRHLGNFGWLRSVTTGERVCMAPLYDFDHALDATGVDDILIREARKVCRDKNWVRRLAANTQNPIFLQRAAALL